MGTYEEMQLRVEARVRAQGVMDDAVELIYADDNGLDDEERAACWLLAWSLLPEDRQERASLLARARLMSPN